MIQKIAVLVLLFSLVGCTSFKESVGQYVTEAVTEKVVSDVDGLLEKRGLSRAEIKQVVDANNDGTLDRQEILETTKAATRDAVLLEARNLVDSRIDTINGRYADNNQVKSMKDEFWLWILGLISAYLGKQVYSAKQDSRRDVRIALLEKLLHRDIDGDGTIGTANLSREGDEGAQEDPSVTV